MLDHHAYIPCTTVLGDCMCALGMVLGRIITCANSHKDPRKPQHKVIEFVFIADHDHFVSPGDRLLCLLED